MNGISSPNLPAASSIDELLGNEAIGGAKRTVRISIADLISLMGGTGAIADRLSSMESSVAGLSAKVGDSGAVGELATECRALNIVPAVSGTTAVLADDGYPIGFTIQAGSAGRSAGVFAYPLNDPAVIRSLTGRTLLFIAVYDAPVGFLAIAPLADTLIDIGRNLGIIGGSLVSEAQVGRKIIRMISYTVAGTEEAIGVIAQVSLGAAAQTNAAAFKLESLTYRVVATTAASAGGETIERAISRLAADRGGVSLMADAYEPTGAVAAGVSWLRDPRTNYPAGWKIPAGTPGGLTYLNWVWYPSKVDLDLLRGARVRFTLLFEASVGYDRIVTPIIFSFARPAGGGALDGHRVVSQYRDATHRAYVIEGALETGVEQIVATIQNGRHDGGISVGDRITTTTDTLRLIDVVLEIVEPSVVGRSSTTSHHALAASIGGRSRRGRGSRGTVRIATSGGDFTSIDAAVAASIPDSRFSIEGEWNGSIAPFFFPTADRQDFEGASPQSVLAFSQDPSASLVAITNNSACDLHYSNALRHLRLTATNARYVVHADAAGTIWGRHQIIEDCVLQHLGNETARAYWVAAGQPSAAVWSNCYAIGAGLGSGGIFEVRRSRLQGYASPALVVHNWGAADEPCLLDIDSCDLDPRDPTGAMPSFQWSNIGSGQRDVIRLIGNRLGGPIAIGSWPWQEIDPAKIPADKMTSAIGGYGNTPAPTVILDDGSRALRIDSATTGASSSVTVSGTAATALFGGSVPVRGAVGLAGGVYGLLDVGDHAVGPSADQAVTQLGKRLGDCSTTSKILTVLIDGSTTKTVTFSTDLRSVSNTTILASINSALGASATASLMDVNALFRPMISDEETSVYNGGSTTILRRMAVAWASSGRPQGRVMTSSDPERLFAGIAYEDIRPGEWGRVKTHGVVRVSMDLLRSDSGSFAEGDYFGVGTTAGMWVRSPAVPLLVAVNAFDVSIPDRLELDAFGAWLSFAPVVTSQTGTLTTTSATGRYRKIGRVVHFDLNVVITTNGTGGGAIIVNGLPTCAAASFVFIGRESASNGKAILGYMNPSTSYIYCTYYDATYPGANGRQIILTGSYEAE